MRKLCCALPTDWGAVMAMRPGSVRMAHAFRRIGPLSNPAHLACSPAPTRITRAPAPAALPRSPIAVTVTGRAQKDARIAPSPSSAIRSDLTIGDVTFAASVVNGTTIRLSAASKVTGEAAS